MDIDQDRTATDLLIRGLVVSRMIRVAADLALADRIGADARCDVRDLATACNVLPMPLLRVLRALAAFGIFRVTAEGIVSHSRLSLLLRQDAPNSLHYAARFWTSPGSWQAWGALDAALTGGIPHLAAWNTARFDYLREHPDEARVFQDYMAHFPDDRHGAVAAAYDFSEARLIADIGGGNGEALRRILSRFPAARGLLYDRDNVVGAIPPTDLANGRLAVQGGSFFESVPEGADVYLLVLVLHDWPDEDCLRILRTVRAAMTAEAKLLVVEQILEPDPAVGPPMGYVMDVHMMVMFGSARERSEKEFNDLLVAAGFARGRVIPTAASVSIIETTRA